MGDAAFAKGGAATASLNRLASENREMASRKTNGFIGTATLSALLLFLPTLLYLMGNPMVANATTPTPAQPFTVALADVKPGGALPDEAAFCGRDGNPGQNVSPAVSWTAGPGGTRSYVLLMVDVDVPQDLSLIGKPDVTIPEDAPRRPFYHWVLADIPASVTGIDAGADSRGVTPKGKPLGPTPYGVRGVNDYAGFFNGNPETAGPHGGYDGPCPPANDARLHHYAFRVYALDVESLALKEGFDGKAVEEAMAGHILAQAEVVGTYTMNPALR
jgi:Raf kinase inhibitor-like YbhB/YbcL family protein